MENKNQLHNIFSNVNPLLIDLLSNMLKFNPSMRLTAEQCLTSSIFDEIRDLSREAKIACPDIDCIDQF